MLKNESIIWKIDIKFMRSMLNIGSTKKILLYFLVNNKYDRALLILSKVTGLGNY